MIHRATLILGLMLSPVLAMAQSTEKLPTKKSVAEDTGPTPASDGVTAQLVDENSITGERVVKVPHPNAAKGLVSIEADKAYIYKTPLGEKQKAASFGVSMMPAPSISSTTPYGNTVTYQSLYGSGTLYTIFGNYEWIPFKKFGSLGLVMEAGVSTSQAPHGILASGYPSQESYTLYMVPVSLFAKYRFEYVRRQVIVPYVEGGFTYYGLAEVRSDGKYNVAGTEAVGGGGGLMFNISRISPSAAFVLDREYGVTDLWFSLSARQMAGLKTDLDMSGTNVLAGFTMDY